MDRLDFEVLKRKFIQSELPGKISIYVESVGLTKEQYKELLRHYPLSQLERLEKALG